MPSLPPELRVVIHKVDKQYHAVTQRADTGKEVCQNTFTHDPEKLIHAEPQWMLERGARGPVAALRADADPAARPPDDKLLIDYGQRLYGYLFGDGAKLKNFFEFAEAYAQQACLTLCLAPDAAALWGLPWEYLHDGTDFLCLTGKLLVHRLPEGLGKLSPAEAAPPLRILVVIASPDDQAELDVERELGVMQDALDDVRRDGLVQIDFLDDATLPALHDALRRQRYHIVHFTGHGVFHKATNHGVLCFENAEGQSDLVGPKEISPLLIDAPDLRVVVLSACQSAQTSGTDAFDSVATGLLQANVPAVLAMQYSILDDSAIELARKFYTELAQGRAPEEAVRQTRLALRILDETRPPDQRRYDWGVPALYVRAPAMRLIDPSRVGASLADAVGYTQGRPQESPRPRDLGGLVLPRLFVGRRKELRDLRRAVRQHLSAIYLRGLGGIGKTTLAAKLLDRPGVELDGTLVIRCNELSLPVDALTKIANFWQVQSEAGARAAATLLDTRQDPADRARAALQLVANHRDVIVFDNLESWLDVPPSQGGTTGRVGDIVDATLREVLRGLLSAHGTRTTFVFTGRYRWAGFEALPPQNRLEIQLTSLSLRQAILLMNALPRLEDEKLDDKLAAYQLIGGHPKTIELLDGWLSTGRSLRALLDDPALKDQLAHAWENYFLNDLLARLIPANRDALTTLAILEEPFWWETVQSLARVSASSDDLQVQPSQGLLDHFLDLSLIQFHAAGTTAPWYTLHPVVREYLLNPLPATQRRDLHLRATAYYGAPFIEAARQYVTDNGQTPTEEQIAALARDRNGVVGMWVSQTQDMDRAHWAMDRALQWQHHLFQAGQVDAADDLVNAVYAVLARWGQRDAAKALLRRSIDTLEDTFDRAVAQGNLAGLLAEEGRLAETLATYEQVYETFTELNGEQQMAMALHRQSIVLFQMGDYSQAINKSETALQMQREIHNEEGQAISLHQLSMLYRMKEDYEVALARSQEAEALNRKLNRQVGVASNLHEQGLIFTRTKRPNDAFERFQQRAKISRRIGDESGTADSLGELGKLYRNAGMMREAIAAFNEAAAIYQRLGDPKIGQVLEFLGTVHEKQGEYAAALEKYQQAQYIYQQAMPTNLPIIEQLIARVRGKMGK